MTRTEIERLAVVESKIDAIETMVEKMDSKLDAAITCKADKEIVEHLGDRVSDNEKAVERMVGGLMLASVLIPIATWALTRIF